MKVLQTIPITPIDLIKQRITKVHKAVINLRDNSLEYILHFDAEEPQTEDEELLADDNQWKEVHNNFHVTAAKGRISGVEKSYQPASKVWLVAIMLDVSTLKSFFKDEEAAETVRKQIDEYLFEDTKIDYATFSNGQRPN